MCGERFGWTLTAFVSLVAMGCSGEHHGSAGQMGGMMGSGASAMSAQALPEPDSVGAHLLNEKCGGCHAPPHPNTHTAMEWVGVVGRMQNYRIIRGHGAIAQPEQQRLLEYLQAHAKSTPSRGS